MGACKQEYNPPPNRKRVSLGGELVGSGELVIQNTLVANQKLEKTEYGEALLLCLVKPEQGKVLSPCFVKTEQSKVLLPCFVKIK